MPHAVAADHTLNKAAPQRPSGIAVVRAVLALLWAAALVLAIGDDVPRTDSEVPFAAAALLASYPVIDVVASLLGTGRVLRINAALSALAVAVIAATAFGSDSGATLAAFGSWAAVSGAIQLAIAVHGRAQGRQLPMIVSGGLSTIAGVSFVLAAGMDDAHFVDLAGYMGLGAVLFLVFAFRTRATLARRTIAPRRPAQSTS